MTGKKSRPYERARSRICFLAASSSSGKGARVWEAITVTSPANSIHPEPQIHRRGAEGAEREIGKEVTSGEDVPKRHREAWEDGVVTQHPVIGNLLNRPVRAVDSGRTPIRVDHPNG